MGVNDAQHAKVLSTVNQIIRQQSAALRNMRVENERLTAAHNYATETLRTVSNKHSQLLQQAESDRASLPAITAEVHQLRQQVPGEAVMKAMAALEELVKLATGGAAQPQQPAVTEQHEQNAAGA